jgi:hypothetical protein
MARFSYYLSRQCLHGIISRCIDSSGPLGYAHLALTRGLRAMEWPLASPGQSPRRQESWLVI